jgi:hypothetical protein
MPQRRLVAFDLDEDLIRGIKLVRERDGIFQAEQVRRALRQWLEQRGALKPPKKGGTEERRTRQTIK